MKREDDKLAGHAAYDLGVIKEVQGEKEAANEWYQMARKLLGSKFPDQ